MKFLTPCLFIFLFTISCRKTSPSSYSGPGADSLMSSVWILDSTDGWLDIDSVKYDNNENISQITRFNYLTTTMAIPGNPIPGSTGYTTYSFTYSGTNKNPVAYSIFSSYSPNIGVTEQHILAYDNQQRLIEDSTLGVVGNDTIGYSATNTNSRVVYYTYNGSQVYYTSYNCDLSISLDTLGVSAGNTTSWIYWMSNPYIIGIYPGQEKYALTSATYTSIDNPLYKNGIYNIWSVAQNMYESQVQALSAKMAQSESWYIPMQGSWTGGYTWVTDSKGRLTSGVEDNGLQYRFNWY